MKKWTWFIWMMVALLACTREQEELQRPAPSGSAEGQKLTVHFSITGAKPVSPTKVLDNGGDIEHLYLAVYGSSGYLKEYQEATNLSHSTTTVMVDKVVATPQGGTQTIQVEHTLDVYTYSVQLTITDSPRTIHFLGNGPASLPFGYDTAVMPLQMSRLNDQNFGEKAYWQMIDLPEGIRAQRNENENYVDADGNEYLDANGNINPSFGGFILDETQKHYFQEIPLVRNWAKIVLYAAEGSNFTPHSLAVINFPSQGSIAPYSAATDFVRDYQLMGFEDLKEMGYPANLPAGTEFDDSKPPVSAFQAETFVDGGRVAGATTKEKIDADAEDDGCAVYLYERPVPSEKIPPTFVIIYGHYRNPEGEGYDPTDPEEDLSKKRVLNEGDYFYKVDLMETSRTETGEWESSYYPIYRNFKYQIMVKKILSMGHATPEAAAVSAGSADVSADITTGHLSDISDGVGRLHLTWMGKTYMDANDAQHPVSDLKVYFSNLDGEVIPDEEDSPAVRVKLLPPADGGTDIIYQVPDPDDPSKKLSYVGPVSTGTDVGWRPIRFCTVAPGKTARTQTMRITGYHGDGRLYRDVVISVQPIQPMLVKCEKPSLYAYKGAEQAVTISIPEGLTKTMFPLEFLVEPQDRTLSPDNTKPDNNLPVVTGVSISQDPDYAEKPTYYFSRTLTWDQYREAPLVQTDDDRIWRTVTCYFKTNCASNATRVWVKSRYFETTSDSFDNYDSGLINNYSIPVPIPRKIDESIPFKFEVAPLEDGTFPELTLRVRSLVNDPDANTGVERGDIDTYYFTPSQVENQLMFKTTTNDGDFELEISAPGYNTVNLAPYFFNRGAPARSYGLLEGMVYPIVGTASFWSNLAFQRVQTMSDKGVNDGRGVIFGYYDDPHCLNTTVSLTDSRGNSLSLSSNESGIISNTPLPFTPTGPQDVNGVSTYHEIQLKTVKAHNDDNVAFALSSPGYVTETFSYQRLQPKTHLHTGVFSATDINKYFKADTKTLTPPNNSYDKASFVLSVVPIGDNTPAPYTNKNGLYLGGAVDESGHCPGGKYQLTFKAGDVGIDGMENNRKNQRFFTCFFQIDPANVPVSITPVEGHGTCFQYPGSDKIYQWVAYESVNEYVRTTGPVNPDDRPRTIIIEAGTDHPVLISRFIYKGLSDID